MCGGMNHGQAVPAVRSKVLWAGAGTTHQWVVWDCLGQGCFGLVLLGLNLSMKA